MIDLQKIRIESGKSLSDLIGETGLTYTTIRNAERGLLAPSVRTVEKIAEAYDVKFEDALEASRANLKKKATA